MRKSFENSLIEIIRAVVIEQDNERAKQIVSMAKSTEADCNSECEYNSLRSFAKWHQLEHFVDYAMYCDNDSIATSSFYASVSVTAQQAEAAREVSTALSSAGMEHILLKGTVIRALYPESWMRNSCDIDILVHEEELEAAQAVIETLGYRIEGEKSLHDIALYKGFLHIELHYRLIEDFRISDAAAILNNLWKIAYREDEKNAYALSLPDEIIYLYHITHMAKHFGDGGCGIRPVLDTWILNHRCEFDKNARDVFLKQTSLKKFESAICALSEYWFGHGTAEGLESVERYIFSGGAYGNLNLRRRVTRSRRGRVRYILSRLFISYRILCLKYPVLKKHSYLFPILEIWRWHEFFGKDRKKHSRELRESLKKSEDIDIMIDELGLSKFR